VVGEGQDRQVLKLRVGSKGLQGLERIQGFIVHIEDDGSRVCGGRLEGDVVLRPSPLECVAVRQQRIPNLRIEKDVSHGDEHSLWVCILHMVVL